MIQKSVFGEFHPLRKVRETSFHRSCYDKENRFWWFLSFKEVRETLWHHSCYNTEIGFWWIPSAKQSMREFVPSLICFCLYTLNPADLTCLYFRISTNLISKLESQALKIESVETGATNRNKCVFNFTRLLIFSWKWRIQ